MSEIGEKLIKCSLAGVCNIVWLVKGGMFLTQDDGALTFHIEEGAGRSMLNWEGKRPLRAVKYCEALLKEQYGEPDEGSWVNRLYWGDNLQVMGHLMKEFRGKIKLIYIDPPFDSKADYRRRIRLKKGKEPAGEASVIEEMQYTDIWADHQYLQFMYQRLQLIRELLSEDGSLYVHMDYRQSHYIKVILDEIFGSDNFRNEIIVRRATKNLQSQFDGIAMLNTATDSIFWYSKNPGTRFRLPKKPAGKSQRRGRWAGFYNKEERPTMQYEIFGKNIITGQWKWSRERALKAAENYERYLAHYKDKMSLEEYWEKTGRKLEFLRPNPNTGSPEYWVEPREEVPCDTNWLDIPAYSHKTGYPTEKSEKLLERIIEASSDPGDIVADFFCGSGTTLAAAQRLGRRWIGSDINLGAVHTTVRRISQIIKEQKELARREKFFPAFAVYSVNHWDIFKNDVEAKEMVMKLYGVKPLRRSFFDGVLEGRWVKVVEPNRICSKEDVRAVFDRILSKGDKEIEAARRRGVLILCGGLEDGVQEYARGLNAFDIPFEIRSFLIDRINAVLKQSPETDISIRFTCGRAVIEIRKFYSPALMKKLQFKGEGKAFGDWRQAVDAVFIDPSYDDEVFRPSIQDVPDKKGMVLGVYELPLWELGKKIAVKIVDVLSGEFFSVGEVEDFKR